MKAKNSKATAEGPAFKCEEKPFWNTFTFRGQQGGKTGRGRNCLGRVFTKGFGPWGLGFGVRVRVRIWLGGEVKCQKVRSTFRANDRVRI